MTCTKANPHQEVAKSNSNPLHDEPTFTSTEHAEATPWQQTIHNQARTEQTMKSNAHFPQEPNVQRSTTSEQNQSQFIKCLVAALCQAQPSQHITSFSETHMANFQAQPSKRAHPET